MSNQNQDVTDFFNQALVLPVSRKLLKERLRFLLSALEQEEVRSADVEDNEPEIEKGLVG